MGCAGDFNLEDRVFFAILPLVFLVSRDRRTNQKACSRRGVFEYHLPVICRMKILFHVAVLYLKRAAAARFSLQRRLTCTRGRESPFRDFPSRSVPRTGP